MEPRIALFFYTVQPNTRLNSMYTYSTHTILIILEKWAKEFSFFVTMLVTVEIMIVVKPKVFDNLGRIKCSLFPVIVFLNLAS